MIDEQRASDSDDHNGYSNGMKQDGTPRDEELVLTTTASLGTLEAAVMNSTGGTLGTNWHGLALSPQGVWPLDDATDDGVCKRERRAIDDVR